ncbi:hypothetical protein B0T17DRAFT_505640 [Bombardia bombarda]|uniref:Uncharacterized protein n=1 Tax=Bombardia bombarda TaxID=252184 RepID=A0AA39X823_9PEZI|nr:hypothetical protein B0T17DRAFT_505640 [Bombardia bombarda]
MIQVCVCCTIPCLYKRGGGGWKWRSMSTSISRSRYRCLHLTPYGEWASIARTDLRKCALMSCSVDETRWDSDRESSFVGSQLGPHDSIECLERQVSQISVMCRSDIVGQKRANTYTSPRIRVVSAPLQHGRPFLFRSCHLRSVECPWIAEKGQDSKILFPFGEKSKLRQSKNGLVASPCCLMVAARGLAAISESFLPRPYGMGAIIAIITTTTTTTATITGQQHTTPTPLYTPHTAPQHSDHTTAVISKQVETAPDSPRGSLRTSHLSVRLGSQLGVQGASR